jgi:hypothetical protein
MDHFNELIDEFVMKDKAKEEADKMAEADKKAMGASLRSARAARSHTRLPPSPPPPFQRTLVRPS